MRKYLWVILAVISYHPAAFGQENGPYPLYVSKQTGEYTEYRGQTTKETTDDYEQAQITLNLSSDVVSISVDPSDGGNSLSIGIRESKTWKGVIKPNVANAPEPGSTGQATLSADITLQYSRPEGGAGPQGCGNETITGTHKCGKCDAHPKGGTHEEVSCEMQENIEAFEVKSLKVEIQGKDLACKGAKIKLTADEFPKGAGGTFKWVIKEGNLTIDGADDQNAADITGNGAGKVEVTFTIESDGTKVTYSDTKEVVFFDLDVRLERNRVCDGSSVNLTLKPLPNHPLVTTAKVMACLNNLQMKSETTLPSNGNVAGNTNINFAPLNAALFTTGSNIFWYDDNGGGCKEDADYNIWAEGTCSCDGGAFETDKKVLTVHTKFGAGCFGGDWSLKYKVPNLGQPVYTNPNRQPAPGGGLTIGFNHPAGYPDVTVTVSRVGNKISYLANFAVGSFRMDDIDVNNFTSNQSQFFGLVEQEKNILNNMLSNRPASGVPSLAGLLDPATVIANTNAGLNPAIYPAENDNNLRTYLSGIWFAFFIPAVNGERVEFQNVNWAQLKADVKAASKAQLQAANAGRLYRCDAACPLP